MKQDKLLYTILKTPISHYIYDANINKIEPISLELYNYFSSSPNLQDMEVIPEVSRLQKKGLLLPCELEDVEETLSDDMIDYYLNNKLKMLSLQLTQQCNFRCSYCMFTKSIDNRPHTNQKMTIETAFSAIEFFSKRVSDSKSVNIGFYGGEPLLEYETLKECISYAKKELKGKSLTFSLTTNASLLSESIMEYLVANNVHVLVSLDGPKEIHDYNRKNFYDGAGTFDVVFSNLKRLLSNDIFKHNISINAVINPSYSFEEYNAFFNSPDFRGVTIYSPIVSLPREQPPLISKQFAASLEISKYSQMCQLLERPLKTEFSIYSQYKDGLMNVYDVLKTKTHLPKKRNHSGPCMPGIKRLFVNVNGMFLPCEKVSESNPNNYIGSIKTGFDVHSVRKIMNSTQCIKDNCKKCWAIRFCDVCAKIANSNDDESIAILNKHCSLLRNSARNNILDVIALEEVRNYEKSSSVSL